MSDAIDYVNPTSNDFLGLGYVAGDDWNPLDPGDPPPAPDFGDAAQRDWLNSIEGVEYSTSANRYDVSTPMGSLSWDKSGSYQDPGEVYLQQNPDVASSGMDPYTHYQTYGRAEGRVWPEATQPSWTQTVSLTPEAQALFDKGLMMQDISADIGLIAGEQLKTTFADPFELDDFDTFNEEYYDAMLSRIEEDMAKDWEQEQASLYAGGHSRGDAGYQDQRYMHDRSLTDARLQTYIAAEDNARNARQQEVNEAILQRNQPINEYNAWRTGSQVAMPTFQPTPPAQTPGGSNYLGAAGTQASYDLAGYNADVMGRNAMMSGLFGLGSAYMLGAPDDSFLWG